MTEHFKDKSSWKLGELFKNFYKPKPTPEDTSNLSIYTVIPETPAKRQEIVNCIEREGELYFEMQEVKKITPKISYYEFQNNMKVFSGNTRPKPIELFEVNGNGLIKSTYVESIKLVKSGYEYMYDIIINLI